MKRGLAMKAIDYTVKGKAEDGKWTEGYYFRIWNEEFLLWGTTNGVPNQTKIKPGSACRRTGIQAEDEHGNIKFIFENDIVRIEQINAWTKERTVKYPRAVVSIHEIDGKVLFHIEGNRWKNSLKELMSSEDKIDFHIIGNLYDGL